MEAYILDTIATAGYHPTAVKALIKTKPQTLAVRGRFMSMDDAGICIYKWQDVDSNDHRATEIESDNNCTDDGPPLRELTIPPAIAQARKEGEVEVYVLLTQC
jgi:hypothetical protein